MQIKFRVFLKYFCTHDTLIFTWIRFCVFQLSPLCNSIKTLWALYHDILSFMLFLFRVRCFLWIWEKKKRVEKNELQHLQRSYVFISGLVLHVCAFLVSSVATDHLDFLNINLATSAIH